MPRLLATVTNNEDPAKGGAIKAAMQFIAGEEFPEWLEPIAPSGWYFHPDVGDIVEVDVPDEGALTEFSEDARYYGSVTPESEGYPEELMENYPDRRGIKTKAGHLLILDDKTGDWKIETAKAKHQVNLFGTGKIEISNTVVGSKIEIDQLGKITLSSPVTDLNAAATDYLLKGTSFFNSFVTIFLNAWQTALSGSVDFNAYKAALAPLISALIASSSNWLSSATRTK